MRLDAYAKLNIMAVVSGMGVEVVWRLVVELVTLAQLAPHDQPKRHGAQSGRDPACRCHHGGATTARQYVLHVLLNGVEAVGEWAVLFKELHTQS